MGTIAVSFGQKQTSPGETQEALEEEFPWPSKMHPVSRPQTVYCHRLHGPRAAAARFTANVAAIVERVWYMRVLLRTHRRPS